MSEVIDWGNGTDAWPMLANDRLGDCTIAAVLHYAQAAERWSAGVGRLATDDDAIVGYRALGFDPERPETDTGARISDVVAHWHEVGFFFRGTRDRITAYARVDVSDFNEALQLFGPLLVGAELPRAAYTQDVWTSPKTTDGNDAAGSWGGHCMLLTNWYADSSVDLVTWGGIKHAEQGWIHTYVDEAWAVLHPRWIEAGKSPSGWQSDALKKEMYLMEGRLQNPDK